MSITNEIIALWLEPKKIDTASIRIYNQSASWVEPTLLDCESDISKVWRYLFLVTATFGQIFIETRAPTSFAIHIPNRLDMRIPGATQHMPYQLSISLFCDPNFRENVPKDWARISKMPLRNIKLLARISVIWKHRKKAFELVLVSLVSYP